ncbi:MAG: alpha/beta hydrolase [Deferrisomatales bacterium]|nr:alpha/beta hydrolase [Deferrisomatales bacterium]
MNSEPARETRFLRRAGAPHLAYDLLPGEGPTVVFLGGFTSDMSGTKASALREVCAGKGWACLRLDYSGHGASGGRFEDGSIGRWTEDALAVIDAVTCGPLLLVGSSMGAWIMTLVALARPDRVAGMVGVAAAPDFTEDLIWASLSAEQRHVFQDVGRLTLAGSGDAPPVVIGWELIEDGRRQRVLDRPLRFPGPVRLLHGLADREVPWQTSVRLAGVLDGPDTAVTLLKGGDHRLSAPAHLEQVLRAVGEVRARVVAG